MRNTSGHIYFLEISWRECRSIFNWPHSNHFISEVLDYLSGKVLAVSNTNDIIIPIWDFVLVERTPGPITRSIVRKPHSSVLLTPGQKGCLPQRIPNLTANFSTIVLLNTGILAIAELQNYRPMIWSPPAAQ